MADRLDPDAMPPWLASKLTTRHLSDDVVAGVNDDDCAVIRFGDSLLVATSDYVNARPISMELRIGTSRTLGRLLVASNLADLCGTGADPKAMLVSIMMPSGCTDADFKEVIEGVREEAQRWAVPVVGGDTKLGFAMALSGTAIGIAQSERNLFLKHRARPGDLLWSSGDLGSTTAAVWGVSEQYPSESWQRWAISALTVPNLPLAKSRAVADAELGGGGTDVSDGLGMDVDQLCQCSGVGVIIDADQIPTAAQTKQLAEALDVPGWALAFGIGGDFQFLVTTDPIHRDRMNAMDFHLLGKITSDRSLLLRLPDHRLVELPTAGHQDSRGMTFADEIKSLVWAAANDAK